MKTVWTNGCFDIFHAGHADFLKRCRELGDFLIVGVNVDATVARLKGHGRPVNPLEDRLAVLTACRWVDVAVPFSDDNPARMVAGIRPDVIVKGPGYDPEKIPEAIEARKYGGQVVILDGREISTTQIVGRIRGE